MLSNERFIINTNGNRTAVLIDIDDSQKLLATLEELESLQAFTAKSSNDVVMPFGRAVAEIERERVKKIQ